MTTSVKVTKQAQIDVLVSSLPGLSSATRPSVRTTEVPKSLKALDNVRCFRQGEVFIDKTKILGKGVFGKCYLGAIGRLGPQRVCVKVLRKGPEYESSFVGEVQVMSQCCHPNVPLLFGITTIAGYKCLLMSFHGISGVSYSVHYFLTKEKHHLTSTEWKNIILGIVDGLRYLHDKEILHNDLKNDNVVVDKSFDSIQPCIVDFGKACLQQSARLYKLTPFEKETYKKRHPQVAPEVRDGTCKQSIASNIYSFGRILSAINKENLSIPVLASMSDMCLDHNYDQRPSTNDLYTFLENLFR